MKENLLSPKSRILFGKILFYSSIWIAFSLIYGLIEKGLLGEVTIYPATGNPYEFKTAMLALFIGGGLMGFVMGLLEVFFFNNFFIKTSFGRKVIAKTLIYILAIIFFLLIMTFSVNSIRQEMAPWDPAIIKTVRVFFSSFAFWSIVIYALAIIAISVFIMEIRENIGYGVFNNFLIGQYHKPREEKRIFMFLDMKSSTSIAERLGHSSYYEFLNAYYEDLTEAILQTAGNIYQYVGDEVVISWNLKKGLSDNNCLSCFFKMVSLFELHAEKYNKRFGFVPGFRAGIHLGRVTAGEIGVIKKEIIFTGDVLNTTSRIQSICKDHQVDLLISNDLLQKLDLNNQYSATEIGEIKLRGKESEVKLFTIDKTPI